MTVLHVLTSDQRRGAETSALAVRDELIRRGHHARAIALLTSEGEPRLHLPVLGRDRLSAKVLLRLRREAAGADVVVAHGSRTLPACALALTGPGTTPFVYANIGDPLYWSPTLARRRRVKVFLSRAAGVAARSASAQRVLQETFGVPAGRTRVIPNGREVTRFPAVDATARAAARERLGLPADRRAVVSLGALSPEKRVDVSISALAELPEVLLLIAGEGPQRPTLQALAEQEAPGRVHFLGQVDDVPGLLAAADALVLTSDSEGLPGVLIEAGLSGLPVVSTDVGYVRDIVVDGVTGVLVPPDDPRKTAAAIKRVLNDGGGMGRQARDRCRTEFDMALVADRWESLLRSAAGAAGRERRR